MSKVSGKVTYEDGSRIPASRLVLRFQSLTPPKDPKTHPRPGSADVNVADGTFTSATTIEPGDGLVTGKHKVTVSVTDETGAQSQTLVCPEEMDMKTTRLEIDTASKTLDIKIKKP